MRLARRVIAIFLLAVLAAALFAVRPYAHGAAFVVRAAGFDGVPRRMASWDTAEVLEGDLTVTWRHGSLRGRQYLPRNGHRRPILMVPGVHAAGIDEPRLIGFARQIAAEGHQVITVQLDDLAHYMITTRTTDMIEDAAIAVSNTAGPGGGPGPIGMIGISFGGGLSIVAAGSGRRTTTAWRSSSSAPRVTWSRRGRWRPSRRPSRRTWKPRAWI